MKYEELTHEIIACSMNVHGVLGNGFQEVIYQRALAIELERSGLRYKREMVMDIYYEGIKLGTRRVVFFCRRVYYAGIESPYKNGRCAPGAGDELLSGL